MPSIHTWLLSQVGTANTISLRGVIQQFVNTRISSISTGKTLTSASGSGYSGTFFAPNPALLTGFSPVEIASLAQDLLEIHDIARQDVVNCLQYGLDIGTVRTQGWPSVLPDPVLSFEDADAAATDALTAAKMQWMMATITGPSSRAIEAPTLQFERLAL